MKAEQQEIVFWSIRAARLNPVSSPVTVNITWFEPNRRRDFDNITFAAKFIMDTLVGMRILPDDSQKWIHQIINKVKVDKQNPRIEVSLEEIEHKECNR